MPSDRFIKYGAGGGGDICCEGLNWLDRYQRLRKKEPR